MNIFVNVAIIDSGLNDYIKNKMKDKIIGGCSYLLTKDGINISDNYTDESNHGTACVSLICNNSVNARFYIIKILDHTGRGHGKVLVKALSDLKKKDIKVINMSLSTDFKDIENELDEVCRELRSEGKILVASNKNNSPFPSLPAAFNTVIGVEGSCFNNPDIYWFNKNKTIQCIADNTPIITEIAENNYIFFKSNSKAAAIISSRIINEISNRNGKINYSELNEYFEKGAEKNNWNTIDINCMKNLNIPSFDDKHNTERIDILEEIIVESLKLNDEQRDKLYKCIFDEDLGFNADICLNLLKSLVSKLSISIDFNKVSILDFYNLYTLNSAIYGKWINA